MNILVDLYVMHYNQQLITPFVINYWKLLPLRKIFVMDNESSDNSLFLIYNEFGNKLQIIQFGTNGQFDDSIHMQIKNQQWKQSRGNVDFVIVCDFDECLFDENLMKHLKEMKNSGYTILQSYCIETISKKFPHYSNRLLHKYKEINFRRNLFNDKILLFDPNKIEQINYDAGSHHCKPIGDIKYYDGKIKNIHIQDLSAIFTITKFNRNRERLSEINKAMRWGIQYYTDPNKIIDFFEKYYSEQNKERRLTYDEIIRKI